MARRARVSGFKRFKNRSRGVSTAASLAAIAAFIFRQKSLASKLLKVSAVSGLASVIPSQRGLKRVFGRGRKLSRLERAKLASKGLGALSDTAILVPGVGLIPSLGLTAAQIGLDSRIDTVKRRRSRRRGARRR